jgi:hypothetical protein
MIFLEFDTGYNRVVIAVERGRHGYDIVDCMVCVSCHSVTTFLFPKPGDWDSIVRYGRKRQWTLVSKVKV